LTFRAAYATGADWGRALAVCLAQLDPLPEGANLGFVYMADPLGEMADAILRGLRQATGVAAWIGASGQAVIADQRELQPPGGMAVLLGRLPAGSFRVFDTHLPETLGRHAATALVHADPRIDDLDRELGVLARRSEAFLLGGVVSPGGNPVQLASGVTAGTISGVLIDGAQLALPFLNHGCTPLGPACRITARLGREIRALDDAPALDVVEARAGDLLRRDPARLLQQIWVGEEGPSRHRVIERLARLDHNSRSVVLAQGTLRGDRLLIMRSDAASAQRQLRASLSDLRLRLDGASPGAVLYFTTRERGRRLFGPGTEEVAAVQDVLGKVPLIGLVTAGAIYEDRVEQLAAIGAVLA
jgi:small ligand-binding sensory domain FIST